MVEGENYGQPALYGREAVGWFRQRRQFADAILDFGFTAVAGPFGWDRAIGAYVPPRQPPWQPRHFFLTVEGDIQSDADWDRLVDAHRSLDEVAIRRTAQADADEEMEERRRFEDELATFQVVLAREPTGAVLLAESSEAWFGE